MRFLDQIWNKLMLRRKRVTVGSGLRINGRAYLHGRAGGMTIGRNCRINSDESINPTSGFGHSHFVVGPKGTLTIGDGVGMSHVCITAYSGVTIEDNVLIGSGTKLWDTDFHPIDYHERVVLNEAGSSAPIRVCEGAFIGACCIVLKGVTIGKHSVVGAGSVVTRDIPDNEVWAGNPARAIRTLKS